MLSELSIEREQFFVQSGDLRLEADLLIPSGGSDRKAAVAFSPGSGDSLYQNYAKGLIETYILDVFLELRAGKLFPAPFVQPAIDARAIAFALDLETTPVVSIHGGWNSFRASPRSRRGKLYSPSG